MSTPSLATPPELATTAMCLRCFETKMDWLPLAHAVHDNCAAPINSLDKLADNVQMVSPKAAGELHRILQSYGGRKLTGDALHVWLHTRMEDEVAEVPHAQLKPYLALPPAKRLRA